MIKLKKSIFIALLCIIFTTCVSINSFSMNDNKVNDWKVSTPEEQGMDPKILSGSNNAVKKDYPAVTSLLVVRRGALVYEKYYLGKTKDDYTHVFSVTKSVVSALTGIAVREKFLTGLDQKMADFYPEYFKKADPKKKAITIKQMLTMTAGLEPVDKNYLAWEYSNDWFEYALNKPLVCKPGEGFGYNTGLTHLLGGVIARAAKMNIKAFADRYLFGPLGITNYKWDTDPKGNYGGGTLLYLAPRDMAKFGYLYLKGGKWQEKQVVPGNWVKESTTVWAESGDGRKYGYLFWLENKQDKLRHRKVSMFSAIGYGGQFITVVPELDLVAVITCNADLYTNKGDATSQIIMDYVIPSIR